MKFFRRLTLAYHIVAGAVLLAILALFLLRLIPLQSVLDLVFLSYVDFNLRVVWAVVLAVSVVFNYLLFRMLYKDNPDKQMILFDGPSGKVRVSIFALQELAKRLALNIAEVRSVQARIERTSAKGLDIDLKMTLCSDANILEVTSRVQNLVRRCIQEAVSMDQAVNVSAYVSKIDPVNMDAKTIKGTTKNPYTDIHVPFQGYRA